MDLPTVNMFSMPNEAGKFTDKTECFCCSRLLKALKTTFLWLVYIFSCTCIDLFEKKPTFLTEDKVGFHTLEPLPSKGESEKRARAIEELSKEVNRALFLLEEKNGEPYVRKVSGNGNNLFILIVEANGKDFARMLVEMLDAWHDPLSWRVVLTDDNGKGYHPTLEIFSTPDTNQNSLPKLDVVDGYFVLKEWDKVEIEGQHYLVYSFLATSPYKITSNREIILNFFQPFLLDFQFPDDSLSIKEQIEEVEYLLTEVNVIKDQFIRFTDVHEFKEGKGIKESGINLEKQTPQNTDAEKAIKILEHRFGMLTTFLEDLKYQDSTSTR